MMEWHQVAYIGLFSFLFGFCLCGFIFTSIDLMEKKRQRKERAHAQMREADIRVVGGSKKQKKSAEKLLEELLADLPEWRNPHEPLERLPGESTEHFVERLQEKIAKGEITPNAARASVGLLPLNDMPDEPEKSCLTCEYNENGINRPCSECIDYNKWTPEVKE